MLKTEGPQQLSPSASPQLRLELLGVPQVFWNGRPWSLVRRQARAILFRLTWASEPVGREELADLLWSDKEPAVARRNLVRLLSLLRSELPDRDLLHSDRTAVWLDSSCCSSDVQEFIRLTSSSAVPDWEAGSNLYRGSFLNGFVLSDSPTFDGWQQSISYELERRYLETLAQLVDKFQASGAASQAIEFANQYLAVDELAETIHRSLITLYAASGRRTAALRQYSRCVEILHHELGVEPLPETRAAFEAARDGSPVATPHPKPKPDWSTLPGLDLPLTGREEAWRELQRAYQQQQSGGAILISGAPGIGKSRLMQEFATGQSSLVLVGNCHTGSQALSFQPLVQALRQGLQGSSQTDRVKKIWLAELSVLLPELRDQLPRLPEPLRLAPDQAQARLLEALTQVFQALAANSRLLLCLDDLHAADEGTLNWLNYTAGQLTGSRICLLVTFRTQEAQIVAEWQRTLARIGMGSQIQLQALDGQAVEALLKMTGTENETAATFAPRIHDATGGNAYFLLETIRELLESGGLQTHAQVVPLPQSVREAVIRRADRLDPLARQVLDMAAVLSPLLKVPNLVQTSARSDLEVAEALDELVLRQFLLPENGVFRFQHDLTREAIYGAVSDWRLRLLHQRVAHTLVQQPYGDGDRAAIIAAHYEAAGEHEKAVANYYEAAIQAQRINTFQIAASYLRSALLLLPQIPDPAVHENDLQERLGDCLRLSGLFEDALLHYQKGLDSTPAAARVEMARLLGKIAATQWPLSQTDAAIKSARRALDELASLGAIADPEVWSVWLNIQMNLAWAYYWRLDLPGLTATLAEVRSVLDKAGNAQQEQQYHQFSALADFLRRRYRLDSINIQALRVQLENEQKAGDRYSAADAEFRLGFVSLWAGDLALAQKHLQRSLKVAEDLEVHFLQVQNLTYLQVVYRLLGDLPTVRERWARAKKMTEQVGSPVYISQSKAMSSWLVYREHDWDKAVIEAQAALTAVESYPFEWLARWVLLAIAVKESRVIEAIAEARAMTTPPQHLQEEPVNAALESAVSLWDSGDKNGARESLVRAVQLAEEFHYL